MRFWGSSALLGFAFYCCVFLNLIVLEGGTPLELSSIENHCTGFRCVCTRMHMRVRTCEHLCGIRRLVLTGIPQVSSTLALETRFSLAWKLPSL